MILSYRVLVAGLLVYWLPSVARSQELPKAEDVLQRLEAEIGAPEVRASAARFSAAGKLSAPMMGKASFEEAYAMPHRAHMKLEMPGFGASSMGMNADAAWSTDPAMGVMVLRGKEQGAARRILQIVGRRPWTDMYTAARTVGRRDVSERPCYELEMTAADGSDKWFIDQETYQLARVDMKLPDMKGGSLSCQYRFEDWRREKGVLFPFQRTQKVGLMNIVYQWDSLRFGDDVADSAFDPPEAVVEALAKPAVSADPMEPLVCKEGQREERIVASIRLEVDRAKIGETLAVVLPEVMQHVAREKGQFVGPPFTRYHRMTDDRWEIEAGLPVKESIKDGGRVKISTLPGGPVVTVWHPGAYERLGETYAVLEKWMLEQGKTRAGAFWEVYWTDPTLETDIEKWRTEIVQPIAK